MKTDQEKQFEDWFKQQPFYVQEVYKHGETLFIKDCGNYKHAAVRTAWAAFSFWQNLIMQQAQQWEKDSKEMRIRFKEESFQLYSCSQSLANLADEWELQ